MINVLAVPERTTGRITVGVVLSPDSMFETKEGNPMPGAALTPADARELAYKMLYIAQVIENGKGGQLL